MVGPFLIQARIALAGCDVQVCVCNVMHVRDGLSMPFAITQLLADGWHAEARNTVQRFVQFVDDKVRLDGAGEILFEVLGTTWRVGRLNFKVEIFPSSLVGDCMQSLREGCFVVPTCHRVREMNLAPVSFLAWRIPCVLDAAAVSLAVVSLARSWCFVDMDWRSNEVAHWLAG